MEEDLGEGGLSRRRFLKYALMGGAAGAAALAGFGAYAGWFQLGSRLKPWEVSKGVMDYSLVPDYSTKPKELKNKVLNVAQWYDYWPGKVIEDFSQWMEERWGVSGVTVRWTGNIYTSNEELFTWITQLGKKFDVMFPSNNIVETMERAGLIANMNLDWLPNFPNLFQWLRDPAISTYLYREGEDLLSVPYQWGTTGIGYNTNVFEKEDIEDLGWDVFWLDSYERKDTGQIFNLHKKTMLLDDMRDVLSSCGLKRTGWQKQVENGIEPTWITQNPSPPYNGEFQWSLNETDSSKIDAVKQHLLDIKPHLLTFNTPQQGPYLLQEKVWVDQAWSGDIMYVIRPNLPGVRPIDYFVPKQGSVIWVDTAVIHRESDNLWLAHQFIDYLLQPKIGADITYWNFYATPNEKSFEMLDTMEEYRYVDPERTWISTRDSRTYPDEDDLQRLEYMHDLGPAGNEMYFKIWREIKF